MLFQDALCALQEGQYVNRSAWNDGGYLVLMPGMLTIWKIIIQPTPNAGNYLFTLADFNADDWNIYDSGDVSVTNIVQNAVQ